MKYTKYFTSYYDVGMTVYQNRSGEHNIAIYTKYFDMEHNRRWMRYITTISELAEVYGKFGKVDMLLNTPNTINYLSVATQFILEVSGKQFEVEYKYEI